VVAVGGTPGYEIGIVGIDTNTTGLFTGLPAGDYFISVVDMNGCEKQDMITLTEPPELILSLTDLQNLTCYNDSTGQVEINAEGGVSPYLYGQSTTELNNTVVFEELDAGTLWFFTQDANLCVDSIQVEISQPDSIWLSFNILQPITCFGFEDGEFEIETNGGTPGYLYSVNGSTFIEDSIVRNVAEGNYSIQVQDANMCEFTDVLTLTQPDLITFNALVDSVDCYGLEDGSFTLSPAGGIPDYLISLDSIIWDINTAFDNLPGGNQSVYLLDNNGCVMDSTVFIPQPDSLIVFYNVLDSITCAGFFNASVQLDVSGGTPPFASIFQNDTIIGAVINLDSLGVGDYLVEIYDGNQCLQENTFYLNEPDTIEAEIEPVMLDCFGDQNGVGVVNVIGGSGDFYYLWDNLTIDQSDSTQANLSANITYSVTVFDVLDSSCSVIEDVTPEQPPQIIFELSPMSGSCDISERGVLIEVISGGVDPLLFIAGEADTSEALPQTFYTGLNFELTPFTVLDSSGCREKKWIVPHNPNLPVAQFEVDNTSISMLEPLVNIEDASYNHVSIIWIFGDGTVVSGNLDEFLSDPTTWGPITNPTHEYQLAGIYQTELIVTSSFGCTDTSRITMKIEEDHRIYIPNAFSPNGDGNNDVFNVKGSSFRPEGFQLQIYNRSGTLVYRTVNLYQGWDGHDNKGREAPTGNYIYIIQVNSGGIILEKKGSVLLIR
jgi:gliding motility-associated-like protein